MLICSINYGEHIIDAYKLKRHIHRPSMHDQLRIRRELADGVIFVCRGEQANDNRGESRLGFESWRRRTAPSHLTHHPINHPPPHPPTTHPPPSQPPIPIIRLRKATVELWERFRSHDPIDRVIWLLDLCIRLEYLSYTCASSNSLSPRDRHCVKCFVTIEFYFESRDRLAGILLLS